MENQEIIKQMLDRIDLLVRQNETLKRENEADKATIASLTNEVETLRTAIKQYNGEHKAKETPDTAEIEKTLAKNAKENFASIFGIDLDAARGEADFIEKVRAALNSIEQASPVQPPFTTDLVEKILSGVRSSSPVLSPAFVEKTLLGLRDSLQNIPVGVVIVRKK